MPDWNLLRATTLRNDPSAQRLALIERIEAWLDLPPDQALEQCAVATPDETSAREINQMLSVIRLALRRELAIPAGPGEMEHIQKLAASYQRGELSSSERRLCERFSSSFAMSAKLLERFPAIGNPPSATSRENELRASLAALQERQKDAQQYTIPGMVSVERLNALEALLAEFKRFLDSVVPGDKLCVDASFFAAHAAYALGRGWRLLGRTDRAAQRFADAAKLFEQAGVKEDASASAELAHSLGYAVLSDIDGASAEELRTLVEDNIDPLTRAHAFARLSRLSKEANAVFDAADYADRAAAEFEKAGYPDPERRDFGATFDVWIETACRSEETDRGGPLKSITEVGQTYLAIFGARHAQRCSQDPAGAACCEAAVQSIGSALLEAATLCAAAQDEVAARLARYIPTLEARTPSPPQIEDLERNKSLLTRLNAIQTDANAADAAQDHSVFTALRMRAASGVQDALALGVVPTIGLAYYIDAYVRLRANDAPGATEAAIKGEEAILAGAPATPESMAGHPEFDQLLMLRGLQVQALVMQHDMNRMLELAKNTVALIESQRYRISDPYQQGAFLAGRSFFYEMCAFAAFKLKRWDDLLSAMELIKARTLLSTRWAPPSSFDDSELSSRLAFANKVLATAPEGSEARRAAIEQRRLLLSLRAIARKGSASAEVVPNLSLSRLQATLQENEAAISWVWISPSVLILLAFDAKEVHADRAALSAVDQVMLDGYVKDFIAQRWNSETLGNTVTHLVAATLPQETREFVSNARRLILSPHRALHLLPFHAASFGDRFLIELAAIRYAPNLTSLLAPEMDDENRGDGGLLAIGVDAFNVPGESWPLLANAEAEAKAVAAVWTNRGRPVDILTGKDATIGSFHDLGDGLAKYRCVHLATHGASVFEKEAINDPLASRLILQDGALDTLALSQVRLEADVVVLSACSSGQRALGGRGLDQLPGDDVFGLQAAFFEAGARGVIGALWPVFDKVAALITTELHKGLASGVAPDLALQEAFLSYLRRPDVPRNIYAWASMFLSCIGRGRQVV